MRINDIKRWMKTLSEMCVFAGLVMWLLLLQGL